MRPCEHEELGCGADDIPCKGDGAACGRRIRVVERDSSRVRGGVLVEGRLVRGLSELSKTKHAGEHAGRLDRALRCGDGSGLEGD
jgi:hypothetical protein